MQANFTPAKCLPSLKLQKHFHSQREDSVNVSFTAILTIHSLASITSVLSLLKIHPVSTELLFKHKHMSSKASICLKMPSQSYTILMHHTLCLQYKNLLFHITHIFDLAHWHPLCLNMDTWYLFLFVAV